MKRLFLLALLAPAAVGCTVVHARPRHGVVVHGRSACDYDPCGPTVYAAPVAYHTPVAYQTPVVYGTPSAGRPIDPWAQQRVITPPPAPQVEVPPAPPYPVCVWTPGYWRTSGAEWVWVGGSWRVPPRPGAVWRAHAWISVSGGFVLQPGGWVGA
jgi:hypothetical protein